MKIKLLRSTSLGYAGTVRNAMHHAKDLLPYVLKMGCDAQSWGDSVWLQAHNVHVFVTKDGRKIILRPISKNGYIGISAEMSHKTRCAQGYGMHITNFLNDACSPDDFSRQMKSFALEPITSESPSHPEEMGD